jgi:ATP-dependent helicase/nuclease subunit B
MSKAGYGKTTQLYNESIVQSMAMQPNETIIYIVPEQSTLDVQQSLINSHPNHCLTNIEVLSFGRLSYRMADSLGVAGKTVLSEVGKNMLIRQLVEAHPQAYPFLSKNIHKKGYINELRSLMSEFIRYTISDEDFTNILKATESPILQMKLNDCKKLFNSYKTRLADNYLSGDTLLEQLVKVCHENEWLKASTIIVDGFYGFTPIQYHLLEKLFYVAKDITVTLTVDPEVLKRPMVDESHLYFEGFYTYHQLLSLVQEHPSIEVEEMILDVPTGEYPAYLNHLRDHLYQYPYKVFEDPTKGFYLSSVSTQRKEVAYVRDSILHLVMDLGYSYNDIAVLSGDLSRYERLIIEMFEEAEISYYMDQKKPIMSNDVVTFLLSIIKVFKQNFSYEAMFEYLKSDYCEIDSSLLDYMENYVIRYGVKRMQGWSKEWLYKVPDMHMASDELGAIALLGQINATRESIMMPFKEFYLKNNVSIGDHIRSLYSILTHHYLEEKVKAKADAFLENHQFDQSRVYSQVYRILMDLLDQLEAMGTDEKVDYGTFYKLLESGLEELELAIVPPRMDQIIVGDLTRSRMTKKKAIFVIGVNEGVVPMLRESTGLITDRERDLMLELDFKLAPSAHKNLYREQFYVYMGLLSTSQRLYVSYTLVNEEGKATRPSHLIHMIKKLLPNHNYVSIDALYQSKIVINNPKVVYKQLIKALQNKEDEAVEPLREWFSTKDEWHNPLEIALKGRTHHLRTDQLSSDISNRLYGQTLMNSVTRLEQFSKCPFSHFITYGLKAHEREAYEITMPQLGLIFHRVIELFSKRITTRQLDWSQITDEIRLDWIHEFVTDLLEQETLSVFFDTKRNQHRIHRLKKMLDKALWAITFQIVQGDFRPTSAEWHFQGDDIDIKSLNLELVDDKKMCLRGTIDRVDEYNQGDLSYLTIIDYKSSNQDFDLADIYDGLQLQLLVYLNAAVEVKSKAKNKTVIPAGIFYFKIDDPFISVPEEVSNTQKDDMVLGQFQLKGVVLNDPEIVSRLDRLFVKTSKVIPVTKNKDGQFAKASKVLEPEEFDLLQAYVHKEVERIGNAIVTGDIEVKPFKKKEQTACDYCQYNGICQFDKGLPTHSFRELEQGSSSEIMEKIKKTLH